MNHPILTHCPICNSPTSVTEIRCEMCDLTMHGHFIVSGLASLSPDQLEFVELFLRCEGKINRMEKELNVSYPTVRGRLNDIIHSMGYEPFAEVEAEEANREAYRKDVLDSLSSGKLSPDEAVARLKRLERE
jgi:hypothetical protein